MLNKGNIFVYVRASRLRWLANIYYAPSTVGPDSPTNPPQPGGGGYQEHRAQPFIKSTWFLKCKKDEFPHISGHKRGLFGAVFLLPCRYVCLLNDIRAEMYSNILCYRNFLVSSSFWGRVRCVWVLCVVDLPSWFIDHHWPSKYYAA